MKKHYNASNLEIGQISASRDSNTLRWMNVCKTHGINEQKSKTF